MPMATQIPPHGTFEGLTSRRPCANALDRSRCMSQPFKTQNSVSVASQLLLLPGSWQSLNPVAPDAMSALRTRDQDASNRSKRPQFILLYRAKPVPSCLNGAKVYVWVAILPGLSCDIFMATSRPCCSGLQRLNGLSNCVASWPASWPLSPSRTASKRKQSGRGFPNTFLVPSKEWCLKTPWLPLPVRSPPNQDFTESIAEEIAPERTQVHNLIAAETSLDIGLSHADNLFQTRASLAIRRDGLQVLSNQRNLGARGGEHPTRAGAWLSNISYNVSA